MVVVPDSDILVCFVKDKMKGRKKMERMEAKESHRDMCVCFVSVVKV
jgi:hypothetical protein